MDYLEVLKKIYKPEVGSVWKAPNKIWINDFAHNKREKGFHPAIVECIKQDGVSVNITPGTTKNYNKGSCVFKTNLKKDAKVSYFLFKFSMPYVIDDLINLDRGWAGVEILDKDQLKNLEFQILCCRGGLINK